MKTTADFQLCPLPVWIMLLSSIKEGPWRTLCPRPLYEFIEAVCWLVRQSLKNHQLLLTLQCCLLIGRDKFPQQGSSHRPWWWRVTCWRCTGFTEHLLTTVAITEHWLYQPLVWASCCNIFSFIVSLQGGPCAGHQFTKRQLKHT